VRHLSYVGMLALCVLGTLPLELWLGVRVYRRPVRLIRSLLPVLAVFVMWDLYAIHAGQWSFDKGQMLGWSLPGGLPVEEVLFFVVIPVCSVLAFEAVRTVRGWPAGDE
jgi:lycopene cyclase domain-containing protein